MQLQPNVSDRTLPSPARRAWRRLPFVAPELALAIMITLAGVALGAPLDANARTDATAGPTGRTPAGATGAAGTTRITDAADLAGATDAAGTARTTGAADAAIAAGSGADRPGVTRFASGSALLGDLPAQFGGLLPCADCPGIRQTLDLHPDGAFHWRSEYLGKPPLDLPDDTGRWLFASDGRTLLLFGSRETPVRLAVRDDGTLRLLDLEGRPIRSTLSYELRRVPGAFQPLEPRLRLRGAYTYMADAASFLDCATGQRLPVTPQGDALALERAYMGARPAAAGAPRIVLVEGRIVQRMPMEGPGPRATLLVDRFLRLAPAGESCPPSPANLPLEGTRWRLTQLDGEPVPKASGRGREAALLFDAAQSRVAGSGGCNALSGGYRLDDERITIMQLAGTMMACSAEAMAQERDFVAILGQARRWLVAGRLLELSDDEERLLARFEGAAATASTAPR